MRSFTETLNEMLVSVFNKILRVEEEALNKFLGGGLSIREMHMIEFIGIDENKGRTLSEIADFLGVARPSVTVSVKKLEQNGLLTKSDCANDGRVVYVRLTSLGRKIFIGHKRFHMLMIKELESGFDEYFSKTLVSNSQ